MRKLEEMLLEFAVDLRDAAPGYEFTQFPREQLIAWWNDGNCILCNLRPDLFGGNHIIELQPGKEQHIPGCTLLSSVRAQVNARGEEITQIRRVSDSALLAWNKPACRAEGADYRANGYRYDPANKDVFYIDPPAPPGKKIRVLVTCSLCPADLTIEDLAVDVDEDCYKFAMAKHYIYAQAYSKESDQSNLGLAQWHANIWSSFLVGGARGKAAYIKPVAGQITVTR